MGLVAGNELALRAPGGAGAGWAGAGWQTRRGRGGQRGRCNRVRAADPPERGVIGAAHAVVRPGDRRADPAGVGRSDPRGPRGGAAGDRCSRPDQSDRCGRSDRCSRPDRSGRRGRSDSPRPGEAGRERGAARRRPGQAPLAGASTKTGTAGRSSPGRVGVRRVGRDRRFDHAACCPWSPRGPRPPPGGRPAARPGDKREGVVPNGDVGDAALGRDRGVTAVVLDLHHRGPRSCRSVPRGW